ncbi:MAG: DNA adenine methylase, partial [Cyanobacteria bacterium J06621_8]
SQVLQGCDRNTFLFLDPPYLTAKKSKLYGKKGDLHTNFEHQKFSKNIQECNGHWLITYDNCPEIKNGFKDAKILEWEVQYGMNNYKQNNAAKGRELFISNYQLSNK